MILDAVAKALLGEPEGEEEDTDAKTGKPSKAKPRRAKANQAKPEEDGEEGDGLLQRFGNWLLARAEVCGRELTGFCDFWTAITTVLVVVQLLEKFTSVNLGNVATEHQSLLKDLLKDHNSFGKK
ncbi:hypothetical protein ABKV19_008529 [Rosa sericea]